MKHVQDNTALAAKMRMKVRMKMKMEMGMKVRGMLNVDVMKGRVRFTQFTRSYQVYVPIASYML